jgi:hypothetical protein
MTAADPVQMYVNRMGELKKRFVAVEAVLQANPGLGADAVPQADWYALESVCLQLRKILELIAFSGLLAHKSKYEQAHEDFLTHMFVTKIARRLDAIHPRWFPEHVTITTIGDGKTQAGVTPTASGFNRKVWAQLYDQMSEILHVNNPFAGRTVVHATWRIPETVARLKRHMQTHLVHIVDGPSLIGDLGTWPAGRCQVHEATVADPDSL